MTTKAKNLLCSIGIDLSEYSVEVIDAHEYRKEILLMSTERKEIAVVQDNYDAYLEQHPDAGLLRMFATCSVRPYRVNSTSPYKKF